MSSNREILNQVFKKLPQPEDRIQCMYVYIDGTLRNFRTKDRTWHSKSVRIEDLDLMEFCGSATDFDVGDLADYYAKPVKIYEDPLRRGNNKIVFCETYSRDRLPTFANNRYRLVEAEKSSKQQVTEFTFSQSYTLLKKDGKPLFYMNPAYDTDANSKFTCGREIADSHYKACLYTGIKLASSEPLTNYGQFRYTIGPSSGVNLGDDVWMSRFLLLRVAEDFGVVVSFDTSLRPSKNLLPISACLELHIDHLHREERSKITDALLDKFLVKDSKPVKIEGRHHNTVISDIGAVIDPYSFITKVLEAFSTRS